MAWVGGFRCRRKRTQKGSSEKLINVITSIIAFRGQNEEAGIDRSQITRNLFPLHTQLGGFILKIGIKAKIIRKEMKQ